MHKVEYNGLSCWADSARYLPSGGHWTHDIAVLSLFGNRNAVRAMWARLVGSKKRYNRSIRVGTNEVSLSEGTQYVTIQTPMSRQMLHLVMVHPSATHQCSPFSSAFLQVGPNPEVHYFARLNRACPIPFRPAWRADLWRLGLAAKLITPLSGFGMPGYRIDTELGWAPVVKELLVGADQDQQEAA